ncbi:MAG: flagellar basal body P-ring protein FlgI [Desulfobacteraceae bacterium]|nr:flagellar basal body P-ring protein FlgI [Desulfobacteraceae bacterium]
MNKGKFNNNQYDYNIKYNFESQSIFKILFCLLFVLAIIFAGVTATDAARIKDLASIKGVRINQLTGYGLIVGLDGTGDKSGVNFTKQSLGNMMEKMNIHIDKNQLNVKNVAAVMVTANIPPFARIGDRIDIVASSLGDAKSLKGGTLLITPLKGINGKIYAIAQGAVTVGAGDDGHLQVVRISNGATVEKEISFKLDGKKKLLLSLFRPDFTTARRMADVINVSLGSGVAETVDASAINLKIPDNMWKTGVAEFIADIESLSVVPDTIARVIINEKTGTVVIGEDVTISPVAIAHGDLSVIVNKGEIDESIGKTINLPGSSTIGELVNGLNSIGASSKDLISILQSIQAAGALQAELEII